MLHCKFIHQSSDNQIGNPYNTSTINFGIEFPSVTLRIFSQQIIDLMLIHFDPSDTLSDWIDFAQHILECNSSKVLQFLKLSANINDNRYSNIRSFLTSLDENSLINAISNHSVYCLESYFLENFIETIRRNEFLSTPSRLESELLFYSLTDAQKYLNLIQFAYNESGMSLYEVESIDSTHTFIADQNFLNQIDVHSNVSMAIGLVHGYWSGKRTKTPILETLIQGSMRIKQRVQM